MLLFGVFVTATTFSGGSPVVAVVEGLLFLGLAILLSPLGFPRSGSAREAGGVVVYWRPGCPYCLRLRLALLGVAERASWVNIWRDPEAAAAVRAVADGNETVPTVVIAGDAMVNPPPGEIRRRLRTG
ncbi:glutaredoxin [Kribbella amoyensis]|uniref:Glutaredoxin n=1 Tax=Kribbella amoyensis TaxID=996641 RepID=A0A561BMR7_9ACTN|nr:glutaredoxin [Kribbella amoyensis]